MTPSPTYWFLLHSLLLISDILCCFPTWIILLLLAHLLAVLYKFLWCCRTWGQALHVLSRHSSIATPLVLFLSLALRQGLTKLARLAINSCCNSWRPWTCYPPASEPWVAVIAGLCHYTQFHTNTSITLKKFLSYCMCMCACEHEYAHITACVWRSEVREQVAEVNAFTMWVLEI